MTRTAREQIANLFYVGSTPITYSSLLGVRQEVRQRILIPPRIGSIPIPPAKVRVFLKINMNLQPIYASFLFSNTLKLNNNELEQFIYEQKELGPGRSVSNYNGWQSDSLDLDSVPLQSFIKELDNNLLAVYNMTKMNPNKKPKITDVWANVNGADSFNWEHRHQGLYSGAYYVKANKNSGALFVSNPNPLSEYAIGLNSGVGSMYGSQKYISVPYTGLLIVFPCWVPHGVAPNTSDEDRISISFNTEFVDV